MKGVKEIDGKACVQLMATADRGSMLICGLQLAAGILERPQAQFLGTLVAEADGLQVTQGMPHLGALHGTNGDRQPVPRPRPSDHMKELGQCP